MKTLKMSRVPDSFKAFLVEGAYFTKNEEYPILEESMISKNIPKRIMPFNKAINYHGDLSDTYVCTYSPDASFERIKRNPKRYIDFFKRAAGIIGFDFSIHSDMQVIKQKSQMNDNLSYTYFFGKNGIPIIPNIRAGIDELLPEFLSAFPKKTLVAVGTNGFIKTRPEKSEWVCFLEEIVEVLEPSGIIVYGTLNGLEFDNIKKRVPIYIYDSWISSRWKEVQKNVN